MPAPFRWITGLPLRAQREIERNFHWIESQVGGGSVTIYDAMIDPSQASDPTAHRYINLTDLLNNETLTSGRTFTVGVIPHNNFTITETGALTLSGPLAITALGKTNNALANPFGIGARVKWNLAGNTISSTYAVFFQGLEIYNSGALIQGVVTGSNGVPYFNDCILHGSDSVTASGSNRKINAPSATTGTVTFATDSYFESVQFNGAFIGAGVHYALFPALGTAFTLMPNNGDLIWEGGSFLNHQTSATSITIGGSNNNHYVRFERMGSILDGSSASGTHTWLITNSGRNHLEIDGLDNSWNLNVNSAAGITSVKGVGWNTVTYNGAGGNNHARKFEGSATGAMSITGPCVVDAWCSGNTTVTLTGIGIRANLVMRNMGAAIWLTCTDLDDSEVTATFAAPGIGSQAYAIDSNSQRNLFLFSGVTAGNFSVASTNASTTSTVITEAGAQVAGGGVGDNASRHLLGQWFQDNVAANQAAVALSIGYSTASASRIAVRPGSITGIVVRSNAARTNGTLTVEVTKNGVATGLAAVLDGTNTTVKATTQATGADTFVAGDEIGVTITTDASWAPTTADVRVEVEVVA